MSGQIEASEEAPAEKKGLGRKKILLLAVPVLLAVIGAGLWFGGILPPLLGMGQPPAMAESRDSGPRAVAFLDLPEIVTNLNTTGRRPVYVKLRSKLELARAEDSALIQASMPRLLDLFQTYLRELRPADLNGSVGLFRLKEELTRRVNAAISPSQVNAVLFKEIIIQ